MITVRLQESNRNFSIGKIICLGRNYAAHIQELGNEVPEEPVVFMKPATSIIRAGEKIVIPPYSRQCQHEVELALLLGRYGKNIPANEALNHIAGYGVALDMTLRDVQNRLKKKGLPWEIAKGFDTSCPISDFAPRAWVSDPHNLAVRLWVNGRAAAGWPYQSDASSHSEHPRLCVANFHSGRGGSDFDRHPRGSR
jgi:acylpyruvate hydrolase